MSMEDLNKPKLTAEQAEQYEDYMRRYPDVSIDPKDLVESEPMVAEFLGMIDLFEINFSLDKLHEIVSMKEALESPLRQEAKSALIPIVSKMKNLESATTIAPEKFKKLKEMYRKLSRAVGIVTQDGVDHNR